MLCFSHILVSNRSVTHSLTSFLSTLTTVFRDQQEKMHSVAIKETGKKAVNIATLISESWKHITPSVRLHYDQLAAEDKFRYMNERIEYRTYLERLKGPQGKTKTTKKKPQGDRARPSAILQDQPNTATAIPFSTSENLYLPAAPGGPSEAPTDTTRPYTAEEMAFLADQLDQESISFLIRALK